MTCSVRSALGSTDTVHAQGGGYSSRPYLEGHTMKDKLENLSITLIFVGILLGMNGDETHLYTNFIGIGIAAIGMVILHAIGRDA